MATTRVAIFCILQLFVVIQLYQAATTTKATTTKATTTKATTKAPAKVVATTVAAKHETHPPHWGYKDNVIDEIPPFKWEQDYPTCNGTRQSPIHIHTNRAQVDQRLGGIQFHNYNQQPLDNTWTVLNNGHTVQISANFSHPPEIRGGGLPSTYRLTQLHFHWGKSDSRGSEHRIDRQHHPLEMHMVHQKVLSDNATQSSTDSTGLAVVSVLFSLAPKNQAPNVHIEQLVNAVKKEIPLKNVNVKLNGFNLAELLPESEAFFRYLGSLTTPPCSQTVMWSVLQKPMHITEAQLTTFRSLHEKPDENSTIVDNDRPIQDLDGRIVRLFPSNGKLSHVNNRSKPQQHAVY